jgi:hypothetical protein
MAAHDPTHPEIAGEVAGGVPIVAERLRRSPSPRPRITASLVNVIPQLIKRLRSYARHLILSHPAVSLEVVSHIGARHSHVKVRELARS